MVPDLRSEFWSPTDLYTSALTNLVVLFLMGLSPLVLEGPKGERRFVKSVFGYVNPFLQASFLAVCIGITKFRNDSIQNHLFVNNVSAISNGTLNMVWFFGIPLLFYFSLSRSNQLAGLLKAIYIIDLKFKSLEVFFNYKLGMRKAYLVSVATTILNFLFVGYAFWMLSKNDIHPSFAAWVAYLQPNGYIFYIAIVYIGMCMRISNRIHSNNEVGGGDKYSVAK